MRKAGGPPMPVPPAQGLWPCRLVRSPPGPRVRRPGSPTPGAGLPFRWAAEPAAGEPGQWARLPGLGWRGHQRGAPRKAVFLEEGGWCRRRPTVEVTGRMPPSQRAPPPSAFQPLAVLPSLHRNPVPVRPWINVTAGPSAKECPGGTGWDKSWSRQHRPGARPTSQDRGRPGHSLPSQGS